MLFQKTIGKHPTGFEPNADVVFLRLSNAKTVSGAPSQGSEQFNSIQFGVEIELN
jgi:hypothetical protein